MLKIKRSIIFSTELRLMFGLMDRVSDGIAPMLKYLEDHIIQAGLADMMVAAELITQVPSHITEYVLITLLT